ncbi:MAG: hypothetical protein JWN03_7414 [Nocardia sp.]|uniref:hypothetical protein n=1 Tax=Nocardia sp. TaxID=1821 RepID=UPI002633B03F|nr:hypothetical protein [Nocardia sp.]MCU1647139.1 hypothetical protein [Nocardia sp.]
MSDLVDDTIENVLEAIAEVVADLSPYGQGRLLALSRALDALTNCAKEIEFFDEPKTGFSAGFSLAAQDRSAVIAAHPAFPASWLDARRNNTVLKSEPFDTIWHKVDDWWYTTGSEVALDSLDLAAQGPFAVLAEPK